MSGRMDIARFGEWATRAYTNEKVRENYSRRFSIRFPNEELPAARPQQTTPLYDRDDRAGRGDGRHLGPRDAAVVRAQGRRAARTSSPSTAPTISRMSKRRMPRACATASASPRSPTSPNTNSPAPGAEASLSRLMTNRMPKAGPHRADADAEPAGKLIGDFTIAKAAAGAF